MTNRQLIELRRSEIRSRLGDISGLTGEALTTEIRSEMAGLVAELRNSEMPLQAAILSEDQDAEIRSELSGEGAERTALIDKAELRQFVAAAMEQAEPGGAEAELLAEFPVAPEIRRLGGSAIPWPALLPREPVESRGTRHRLDREARADAASSLPAGGMNTENAFVGRIFATGLASFLGVDLVSVPSGQSSYFVLSAGVAPAFVAAGTKKDAEAATMTGFSMSPHRVSASYIARQEDIARSPNYETGLRSDLVGAVQEQMDQVVLSGASPSPEGILTGLTAPSAIPAAQNVSFADYLSHSASGVDGKFANSLRDIRTVLGAESYRSGASALTTAGDVAAVDYLLARSGGVMASSLISAPSGAKKVQTGLIAKVGPGAGFSSVAALWNGMSILIRDDATRAGSGEVKITIIGLWDFKVLRSDAYARFAIRLDA